MKSEQGQQGLRGMEIKRFESEEEARREAGVYLRTLLTEASGERVLLLISGGSSLSILEGGTADALGPHVTISTLDERYSEFDDVNNFAQLMQTGFYGRAAGAGAHFLDTRVQSGESFADFARRLDEAIQMWFTASESGRVIATVGVGLDGHVAGMMPYPENPTLFAGMFEDPTHAVIGYDAGAKNKYPLRVTVTMPFLKKRIDEAVVYATGEGKRAALEATLAAKGTLAATPARAIREMRHSALFTNLAL